MTRRGYWRTGIAAAVVLLAGIVAADAETKLTEFNGAWRGGGTDRATPLESGQQTRCHASIHADLNTLNDEMVCDGQAGLHKVVRLSVRQTGHELSGSLTQIVTHSGGSPSTLEGTVSGQRAEDTANLRVTFSGPMPTVSVALKLESHASYSVHATSLGLPLMDVTFSRAGSR